MSRPFWLGIQLKLCFQVTFSSVLIQDMGSLLLATAPHEGP